MKRSLTALFAGLAFMAVAFGASSAPLRDDGIHTQTWMKSNTFYDFREDLQEAAAAGKGLVVLFEQPGCASCKRLHEVNFTKPGLVKYITDHFDMMQINMYGANEVTDFTGKIMSEAEFNVKTLVNFSPTTVFFGPGGKEVFRIPGYLNPDFYQAAFEYVVDGGPARKTLFPRWLRDRNAKAKAGGRS